MRAGGRLRANGPLSLLIAYAYGVRQYQIRGGPSWISTDLFSVEAKADARVAKSEVPRALQTLLKERCALSVDRQRREGGVYLLGVGKNGIKPELLRPGGCSSPDANTPNAPPPPDDRKSQRLCGSIMMMGLPGKVVLQGQKVTIANLLDRLSNFVDRPIIDRTGYTGTLEVKLEFTPDRIAWSPLGSGFMPEQLPAGDENAIRSPLRCGNSWG